MDHDPETLAADYLADMPASDRAWFERHLLACDSCWNEVSLARRGRELAESARASAPAGLTDHVRTGITAAATQAGSGRRAAVSWPTRARPQLLLTVAAGVLAVATAAPLLGPVWHVLRPATGSRARSAHTEPALAATLASFRDQRLPGTAVPTEPAPDLTGIGLRLVAAGAGRLDRAEVDMYVYRAVSGAKLAVYRSSRPFPETDQTREIPGTESAWSLQTGDLTVLCGPATHTMLLISTDPTAIHQVGKLLDLT